MARVRKLHAGDGEYPAWRRWMREVGSARERHFAKTGVDPGAAGEPATVGLLLSAAGAAGLIGLLEYPTLKRSTEAGEWRYGRCDLWITAPRHDDDLGWAFEVKRGRITSQSPRRMLVDPCKAAWRDTGKLGADEASMRLALTVFYSERPVAEGSDCLTVLRKLADMSDWAWRISHDRHLEPMHLLLKRRHRGRCG